MKYSIIGFGIWIGAACLLVFKILSALMPRVDLKIFTIDELVGVTWIERIPWPSVHPWAELLAYTNLSLILFVIGLFFIIFAMFFKT